MSYYDSTSENPSLKSQGAYVTETSVQSLPFWEKCHYYISLNLSVSEFIATSWAGCVFGFFNPYLYDFNITKFAYPIYAFIAGCLLSSVLFILLTGVVKRRVFLSIFAMLTLSATILGIFFKSNVVLIRFIHGLSIGLIPAPILLLSTELTSSASRSSRLCFSLTSLLFGFIAGVMCKMIGTSGIYILHVLSLGAIVSNVFAAFGANTPYEYLLFDTRHADRKKRKEMRDAMKVNMMKDGLSDVVYVAPASSNTMILTGPENENISSAVQSSTTLPLPSSSTTLPPSTTSHPIPFRVVDSLAHPPADNANHGSVTLSIPSSSTTLTTTTNNPNINTTTTNHSTTTSSSLLQPLQFNTTQPPITAIISSTEHTIGDSLTHTSSTIDQTFTTPAQPVKRVSLFKKPLFRNKSHLSSLSEPLMSGDSMAVSLTQEQAYQLLDETFASLYQQFSLYVDSYDLYNTTQQALDSYQYQLFLSQKSVWKRWKWPLGILLFNTLGIVMQPIHPLHSRFRYLFDCLVPFGFDSIITVCFGLVMLVVLVVTGARARKLSSNRSIVSSTWALLVVSILIVMDSCVDVFFSSLTDHLVYQVFEVVLLLLYFMVMSTMLVPMISLSCEVCPMFCRAQGVGFMVLCLFLWVFFSNPISIAISSYTHSTGFVMIMSVVWCICLLCSHKKLYVDTLHFSLEQIEQDLGIIPVYMA